VEQLAYCAHTLIHKKPSRKEAGKSFADRVEESAI
jgi:hypothetical protein